MLNIIIYRSLHERITQSLRTLTTLALEMELGESMRMPTFDEMMNPLLEYLRSAGGRATNEEMEHGVAELLDLPEDLREKRHASQPGSTELNYRLGWTRTYLKKVGLLKNIAPAEWQLTEKGQNTHEVDASQVVARVRQEYSN